MSNAEIIRAWKDPQYRSTVDLMPSHPAGEIELSDPELGGRRAGKDRGFKLETARHYTTKGGCKTLYTYHKCCP